MKAVLLAAGSGTRFKPYSLSTSKIMTRFLGKPLLFFHIDEFIKHGILDIIVICSHENCGEVKKGIQQHYPSCNIAIVEQDIQLGPSDAIHAAKDLLAHEEFFLFKYADSIHAEDLLQPLLEHFKTSPSDGVITLRHVSDTARYGIARLEDNAVVEIVEKPLEKAPSNLGLVGAGILRTRLFFQGVENDTLYPGKKEVAPPEYVLREGGRLAYWIYDGKREDLGKPWDILLTNRLLLAAHGGRIESTNIDPTATIGKDCYIGKKAVVKAGAAIKNFSSIEGVVGEGSVIDNAVIMQGAVAGKKCRISSSVIGEHTLIGDGFLAKARVCENFFVKDKYEKPPQIRLGLFAGDHTVIGADLYSEPGKIVYPYKKVNAPITNDHLIRCVLFDADNTLYNTRQVAKAADMAAMRFFSRQTRKKAEWLYAYWKEKVVAAVLHEKDPWKRHRRYSYRILAEKLNVQGHEEAFAHFLSTLLKKIRLLPGAKELLASLSHHPLAILSEDPGDVLIPKLKKLGLMQYFHLIMSSDSVGTMKPSKEYFTVAMQALGASPHECLVVGDSYKKDLQLPQQLGAVTASYGEQSNADFNIIHLSEIKKILDEV